MLRAPSATRFAHRPESLLMDALSELLKVVKLSGAVFLNAECGAPWCLRSPPSRKFGEIVAKPGSHVIEFHLVAEGRVYIRVGGETTQLMAGDIALLPHGDEHFMGNGSGVEPIDGEPALPAVLKGQLSLSEFGGAGERTKLICGYLVCDERLIQPVLVGLPHVLRVHIRNDAAGQWLENSIRHAVNQATNPTPGSAAVLARLAEVLFAETLRRYVLQLPEGRTGWLAGVGDPFIGRSLSALHSRPAHAWTLDQLAQEVGLSRSALTDRFSRYLGQGPMAYLAEWRLELAADLLRTTARNVVYVAAEVGYDSEAAFNRAFRRRFGDPPARYRAATRAAAS